MKRSTVGLAAMALLLGACKGAPTGSERAGTLVPMDGLIQVYRDGDWEPVSGSEEIAVGERVRAGDDGWARVELGRGGALEIAPGATLSLGRVPTVERGKVLAEGGVKLALDGAELQVSAFDSVYRVDKNGSSVRLAVYRGSASLPATVWEEPIGALQQVSLLAGDLFRAPSPLSVSMTDRWDVRLLGESIDIGAALQQREQGLDPQLVGKRATAAVIRVLGGRVPEDLLVELLGSDLSHAEVVLASVLAISAGGPSVEAALREILELKGAGASWEVVASRMGVGRSMLVVLGDYVRRILKAAEPPGPRGPRGPGGGAGGSGPTGGGDDGPGPGPTTNDPGKKNTPGGGGGGGGGDAPPPPPTCDVACAVDEVVDGIDLPVGV